MGPGDREGGGIEVSELRRRGERTTTLEEERLRRLAGKFLSFRLGEEGYGIPVLKVQEIVRMTAVTRVPRVPDFVLGVINLRGKIIPVIDLRVRLGLPRGEITERSCIVVVRPRGIRDALSVGMVVDDVSDVLEVGEDRMESSRSLGGFPGADLVLGMGKLEKGVLILLEVERLFEGGEIDALEGLSLESESLPARGTLAGRGER